MVVLLVEESKVMAKWQIVIPKRIREIAKIKIGDVIKWRYESGRIIITPPKRVSEASNTLYGLIPTTSDAIEEIKKIREERLRKAQP